MPEVSILIPSRNEEWLCRTVQDILEHMEGDTEVIVVVDGPSTHPIPEQSERVRVVELPEPIGQRAATNLAARMSEAKYVMKCDAHCSFGQGFDRIMMEDMQDDWTMVPKMYNLHAFDWVCPNGHRRYQSPSGPCKDCGEPTQKEVIWIAKRNPESTAMRFDRELHFQYWAQYKRQQEGHLVDTMSLLGACWMLTRERYWALNICDEEHGGWGQQGTEVACKTWLSGGRLVCNKRTWFSHMFRTQGGDFGFPYKITGKDVDKAREHSKELFLEGKWEGAIQPLSWLLEKFWPIPGWSDADLAKLKVTKEIIYYSDFHCPPDVMRVCQKQLERASLPIISVSLNLPTAWKNIIISGERGPLTLFRQILAGLEASKADIIFLAEHDVAYHKSHFDFIPPDRTKIYYDDNFWQVDYQSGHALTRVWRSLSGLCAYRDVLLAHYRKRVELVERNGFTMGMGFEPGTHHRTERVDDLEHEMYHAAMPSIDIRHGMNFTPTRWRKDQFRNKRYTAGWQESDSVPGWGKTEGRFQEFLKEVEDGILPPAVEMENKNG